MIAIYDPFISSSYVAKQAINKFRLFSFVNIEWVFVCFFFDGVTKEASPVFLMLYKNHMHNSIESLLHQCYSF